MTIRTDSSKPPSGRGSLRTPHPEAGSDISTLDVRLPGHSKYPKIPLTNQFYVFKNTQQQNSLTFSSALLQKVFGKHDPFERSSNVQLYVECFACAIDFHRKQFAGQRRRQWWPT